MGYPCLHWHFAIIKKSNFVNHHHSHRAQWLTQSPVRIGGTVQDGCARVGWNRSARLAAKLKEFDLVGRCRSDGISFPSASSLIRLVAYVAEMSISGTTVHPPQIGRNSRMGNDSKWYLSISMSQIKDLTLGWVGIYCIRGHTTMPMEAHFSKKWGDFCGVDVEEPHKHTWRAVVSGSIRWCAMWLWRDEPNRLDAWQWQNGTYQHIYIVDFRGVYCQAGCFVYNLGPPPVRCPVPNWVKMKACRNTNEVIWRLAICFCFPTQLAFDMRINMGRKYYYFWLQHAIQFGWIHLFPIVAKTVTEFEWV